MSIITLILVIWIMISAMMWMWKYDWITYDWFILNKRLSKKQMIFALISLPVTILAVLLFNLFAFVDFVADKISLK